MTAKADDKSKLNLAIIECERLKVKVLPPNINKSEIYFRPLPDEHKILFGFSAINGIGNSLASQILEARQNGAFSSLKDLTDRVPMSTSSVITLIKAGAIPSKSKENTIIKWLKLTFQRREYKAVKTLPTHEILVQKYGIDLSAYKVNGKTNKDALLERYNDIRKAEFDAKEEERWQAYKAQCEEKYLQDREYWEFDTLQSFISEPNPFKEAYEILPDIETTPLGMQCIVAGIVSKVQKKKTKMGAQYAYINVYGTTLRECLIWPSAYAKHRELLSKGNQVVLKCTKEETQLVINDAKPYKQWIIDIKKKRKIQMPK